MSEQAICRRTPSRGRGVPQKEKRTVHQPVGLGDCQIATNPSTISSALRSTLIEGVCLSMPANLVIHCHASSPLSASLPFAVALAPSDLSRAIVATAFSMRPALCASCPASPGDVDGIQPILDEPVVSPCLGLPSESAPMDTLLGRLDCEDPGVRVLDPARDGVVGRGICAGKISGLSRSGVSRDAWRDMCGRPAESRVDEE